MVHWRWLMLWISNMCFTGVVSRDGLVMYGPLAFVYAMD
jgi:hypothetical protein